MGGRILAGTVASADAATETATAASLPMAAVAIGLRATEGREVDAVFVAIRRLAGAVSAMLTMSTLGPAMAESGATLAEGGHALADAGSAATAATKRPVL